MISLTFRIFTDLEEEASKQPQKGLQPEASTDLEEKSEVMDGPVGVVLELLKDLVPAAGVPSEDLLIGVPGILGVHGVVLTVDLEAEHEDLLRDLSIGVLGAPGLDLVEVLKEEEQEDLLLLDLLGMETLRLEVD